MSTIKATDIKVAIDTEFVATQRIEDIDHFVFSYTITIKNDGNKPVQLLSRYWLITDGNGKESTVAGEGVVGVQPHIDSNSEYTYTSGCYLKTPVGTMQGHYLVVDSDNNSYQVDIPLFGLATPNALN